MIIIKSTVSIIHIEEGINVEPCRCDYRAYNDPKWIKFCKQHKLNKWHTCSKWYTLYLELCANGLL